MKTDFASQTLDRRKFVRLRIRKDLVIAPQKYEGRTFYVVKDPVSLRYYRFKEQEHFLLKMMDGKHTLDEAQKEFEKRFRPDRLTLEDLEHFGQQLLTAGLVQNENTNAGELLYERRKKRRKQELLQTFTNILYIKIPVIDPDRILVHMLKYLGWMFTTWFLFLSLTVFAGAILLVATHFETFISRLPTYQEFFSFKTVAYLWFALGVVKVIHEFGHGLSCKAFGGEVHEMGFLILCFSPAMYCNVSDAWRLPNKWHRIIIGGAGIYVELMIAALATFTWWNTPSNPFLNNLSLSLMIVCSVSTVLFNGNPLMRYDGYYCLADWLEIPNLRDRSNRYIQSLVMEHCLGIEVQPEPYMELTRRILFFTYAVISYVYRWVITFVILTFMATFLAPYKLEVISNMLALGAAASMIGWPLFRLGKNLKKRGRLPDMKPVRVSLSAAFLASLVLVFFLLPLPVTRIRATGLVQFQPGYQAQIYTSVQGTLEKILVREGQFISKGTPLAIFRSLDLETRKNTEKSKMELKKQLRDEFERRLNQVREPRDKENLKYEIVRIANEFSAARTQLDVIERELERLKVYAPVSGIVMGLPHVDEVGKQWEKGQDVPFCSLGDPTKLRVLLPVTPSDMDMLRENFSKIGRSKPIPATIRVQGRVSQTWKGNVSEYNLPRSEASEIPLPLSNRGGGPLAIKPGVQSNKLIPQAQVYLVGIDFEDPDAAICTGTMAQAKIHCEYKTAAWWTWRTICATFDINLW